MLDFVGGIMECSFWNKNKKIKKLYKHRIENNLTCLLKGSVSTEELIRYIIITNRPISAHCCISYNQSFDLQCKPRIPGFCIKYSPGLK